MEYPTPIPPPITQQTESSHIHRCFVAYPIYCNRVVCCRWCWAVRIHPNTQFNELDMFQHKVSFETAICSQQNLLSSHLNGWIAYLIIRVGRGEGAAAEDVKTADNEAAAVTERRTVRRRPDAIGGRGLIDRQLLALPLGDNGCLWVWGVVWAAGCARAVDAVDLTRRNGCARLSREEIEGETEREQIYPLALEWVKRPFLPTREID